MSVISFWSSGKEQTGKTLSIVALATQMALERNFKILLISTSNRDNTLKNCYWEEGKIEKNLGLFGPNTNIGLKNGIEGLDKIVRSNKLTPEIITDYTKIVFKDRLEILLGFNGEEEAEYEDVETDYPNIVENANRYYDLVLVDLSKDLSKEVEKQIMDRSDIIVSTTSQRLKIIESFINLRYEEKFWTGRNIVPLIGRYNEKSKYTAKNITRFMGEKSLVPVIPYNTLFMEACEEASVPDLFLKFRKINEKDENYSFVKEIKRFTEILLARIQELQIRR